MRKLALIALGFIAVGCGGSGTASPNPFAGNFAGTWTSPSSGASGTATLSITTAGALTGTIHNTTANLDGTVTGTVSPTGVLQESVVFTGLSPISVSGTVALTSSTQLSGTVTQTSGGNSTAVTYIYTKQ